MLNTRFFSAVLAVFALCGVIPSYARGAGTVTISSASVSPTGVLTLTLSNGKRVTAAGSVMGPKGNPGTDGTAATVSVGTVATGAAGSPASVTNSGTSSAAVLNFTIPQGAPGAPGTVGSISLSGPNTWGPSGLVAIRYTSAATDSPTMDDCNNEVETTNANPVTVSLGNLPQPCAILYLQGGAGAIGLLVPAGETLTMPAGFTGTDRKGADVTVQSVAPSGPAWWNVMGWEN